MEQEVNNDLIAHAKREYELVEKDYNNIDPSLPEKERKEIEADNEYGKMIHKSVIELLELFSKQNHTGLSASLALSEFTRLVYYKNLTPLTGADDEWGPCGTDWNGEPVEQNKRCPSVFRTGHDNKNATYITGKVFSDDNGNTWYTNKHSIVNIEFPFDVPNEPEKVILTKEDRARIEDEDDREFVNFMTSHPEYVEKHPEAKNVIESTLSRFYERHPEEKPSSEQK